MRTPGPKNEDGDEQPGQQAIAEITRVAGGLVDQPCAAEECIAETQAETTQHREQTEPFERATEITAVANRQNLYQRADGHALHEGRGIRSADESSIPQPARVRRAHPKFERHTAQDHRREHYQQG